MTTASVFICPAGSQFIVSTGDGKDVARCTTGQGSWQQVALAEPFDPALLDTSELASALGAGFTVMATGLVIAWAARQVMRAIKTAL